MWNLVKLDGTWYHADPTWDDPVPDVPGRAQYHYFLKSDKTMAKDHTWVPSSTPSARRIIHNSKY